VADGFVEEFDWNADSAHDDKEKEDEEEDLKRSSRKITAKKELAAIL
jgi:hypothetical protein